MVDGTEYTFGVSGKLWRNGLVMYDHQTRSLWSGVTGEALQGSLKGKQLTILASVPKIRWGDWKVAYPDSKVLTLYGFQDGAEDQYAGYHHSGMTGLFAPTHRNTSLPPKTLVMGIRLGDQARAYPLDSFTQTKVALDEFAGKKLVVYRDSDSEASAIFEREVDGHLLAFTPGKTWTVLEDTTTGSTWNIVTGTAIAGPMRGKQLRRVPHYNVYWFAWVDFYPHTTLFQSTAGK
jgi:hypothetical protein